MVRAIVEAACDAQSEGSIDAAEQATIAAEVANWALDSTVNEVAPSPEDAARHAVAIIATQIFLTEAMDMIDKSAGRVDRRRFEERVQETAGVLAQRANIVDAGTSPRDLAKCIKGAIDGLRKIHGGNT